MNTLSTWLGTVLPRLGLRLFLLAWIIDIVYDAVAPATWGHFTYWTAVLAVLGFHLVVQIIGDGLFVRVFQFRQEESLGTNLRTILTAAARKAHS
jgi:hypothetical protein